MSVEEDVFRNTFKYYKSKHPSPSLREVLDFRKYDGIDKDFEEVTQQAVETDCCALFGLKDCQTWKTYTLRPNPGLLYIPNPFTTKGQRYWIQKCLKDYPKKPNKTNIDNEFIIEDWWNFCKENEKNRKLYLKKLRWTTLGYHHDWDTKIYSEGNRHEFPNDLAEMCRVIAQYLGYSKFQAQAAIVNYYHMDSTLSPHTDHSENNLDAPLISISFGQSAIFLIGGRDKALKPSALWLHSGDIVVMSKHSRLSYHAVPKILPAIDTPWIEEEEESISSKCMKKNISDDVKTVHDASSEWDQFKDYIANARINVNVRQVLNENQTCLAGD